MLTQGLAPDPKCKLIIFNIRYTSTFIRLSHLYQEYHVHCIVITNDEDGIGRGWLIYIRVWVGRQRVGIILWFLVLSCAFVYCCLTFSVPLFCWLELDGCCVCFFVFPFFLFVSGPFN